MLSVNTLDKLSSTPQKRKENMRFLLINALLLGLACAQRSAEPAFYLNSETLLEVTANNINSLLYNTSYITFLEFYAPWCGYCKQLKPDMEKLGEVIQKKNLPYQVGIVNCDDQSNSQICSEYGVQGFPSLYTVTPKKNINKALLKSKKANKANYKIEAYNGQRDHKSMLDYLTYMNDSPGFKSVKNPLNFIDKVFKEGSETPIEPFLFYSYEEKDKASVKKMKLIENTVKTVQKDFLTKVNAYKVDKEIVDPLLEMMCGGNEEGLILEKLCKIYAKKGNLNNLLFLVDVENHDVYLYQKNNITIDEQSESLLSTQYQISTYKLTTWLKNKLTDGYSYVLGNGILSPRNKLVQKSIFKNKYSKKNKTKKKSKKPDLDEL